MTELAEMPVEVEVEDAGDDEVEPVELLVQLAKEGEIEPWDIDIVDVTDKFLARLDESDLRTSGRALFYASVLLRMKSDVLMEADDSEEEEEEEAAPWEAPIDGEGEDAPAFDPVDALEAEMDRRLDRKSARGTPETLDELVRELRDAERGSWWKESRSYDTSGSPRGFQRGVQTLDYHEDDSMRMDDEPTESDAFGRTHNEDIDEVKASVRDALHEQFARGRAEVLFEEIAGVAGSRVQTYLGLLFLAHQDVVRLVQDELFGDLWIRDARGLAEYEEAVAN
jgi:segregation and condensation protein A